MPVSPIATNFNQVVDPIYQGGLEDRAIRSDPRENWYLALPNKIQPQVAENILRAALGGDIWQQFLLCRQMEDKWPTFRMAAHQLREQVSNTRYNVLPYCEEGEEPTKSAKEKAGLISRAMKSMRPNPFNDEKGFSGMIYDFSNAMLMGLSLSELIWERKRSKQFGEEMLPRAAAFVHPRHFTFTNEGELAVYDSDYARQYTDPNYAPKNTRNKILRTSPDPDKFICSQFSSTSGSCLMAGFIRPLTWLYIARIWNSEWALNTAKTYGSPFISISYKPGQSDAEERAKLAAFLKQAGPERRLIHPEGTVANIHPSQPMTADNPQRWLYEEADRQALFLLLGQTGTTQATPGKLGGSDTHGDVKEERILGLASWVARNPLRQWARAILRQNYGDDSECPELVPDRSRPMGSTEVGSLVSAINLSGLPVRADEFYKKIGFSQPEPGDLILQRGEISEMMTEEEKEQKAQEQFEMQQQQALQNEGQEAPIQGKHTSHKSSLDLRSAVLRANNKQLLELEAAVTAAERAPHANGELKLVQDLVTNLKR